MRGSVLRAVLLPTVPLRAVLLQAHGIAIGAPALLLVGWLDGRHPSK